jgi:hypothetical protein
VGIPKGRYSVEVGLDLGPMLGPLRASTETTFPLPEQYPDYQSINQRVGWPRGLDDILNRGKKVYGFWADWVDHFYYKDSTEAFNRLLEQCATLTDTPLSLVLHPGTGVMNRIGGREGTISFDWMVKVDRSVPKTEVIVELWVGGQVEQDKVNVPPGFKRSSGGSVRGLPSVASPAR